VIHCLHHLHLVTMHPTAAFKPAQPLFSRAAAASGAAAALAEFRLPPIDNDPNRCARGFVGNTIGQANAVSDKVWR
jgi:hypothetical protein